MEHDFQPFEGGEVRVGAASVGARHVEITAIAAVAGQFDFLTQNGQKVIELVAAAAVVEDFFFRGLFGPAVEKGGLAACDDQLLFQLEHRGHEGGRVVLRQLFQDAAGQQLWKGHAQQGFEAFSRAERLGGHEDVGPLVAHGLGSQMAASDQHADRMPAKTGFR